MAYIGIQPAEKFTSFATQEFSTSATTSYTLDHAVANENEIALFVNNVRQQPGSGKAYTATGTALTLSAATASTDTMYCVFLGRALQTVTPATNSITAAMVGNDLISGKTALGAEPADTDEFLVSDAGTLKRVDYSYIKGGKLKSINATANNTLSQVSNNSSTMADVSSVELAITPASTSSKFVLMTTVHFDVGADAQGMNTRLMYNHSGISHSEVDAGYDGYGDTVNGGGRLVGWTTQTYYLAPSTTNEITFNYQFANNGSGTVYLDRRTLRLIAWEYE
jgi:hypothetical protein